jgi:hypothetical protein
MFDKIVLADFGAGPIVMGTPGRSEFTLAAAGQRRPQGHPLCAGPVLVTR